MSLMTPEYFEKMLDAKFQFIHSEIQELKSDSKEILTQVKATNGRVTNLELWRERQQGKHDGIEHTEKKINARAVLITAIIGIIIGAVATALWH